jgi:hypothetical protein
MTSSLPCVKKRAYATTVHFFPRALVDETRRPPENLERLLPVGSLLYFLSLFRVVLRLYVTTVHFFPLHYPALPPADG